MNYERRAFVKLQTPAITPFIPSGLTTLPSCLRQDTSPYTGEAKLRRLLPPRARKSGRAAPPLYIGLPQRFCEAKDLWEEEERASEPCPDERGAAKFALLRRGGEGIAENPGSYSLSHDTEVSFGCRDSSLRRAPIIRNFTDQESICLSLKKAPIIRKCGAAPDGRRAALSVPNIGKVSRWRSWCRGLRPRGRSGWCSGRWR